jgi:RNA polymerase sigma factor (sigma-70 family)
MPAALARDERLASHVGRGSERAFAALYQRYHQPLYRYCRSMLRDDADAQDALQSTFAAAFAALREGRRDAPLRPWLFRIAHNESISLLRRRRPQDDLPDGLPAREPAIEEQAEQHERLRRLVADLRELPERQRAALLMRELSGLSHEDIALALESSVGTAKQTIYEARRALTEFEEGRMTSCDDICRTISNGDRRALRGRRVRAHLRECTACSAFAAAIPSRSADLSALAPAMPPAATAAVLGHLLAGSVARGSGGTGAVGASAGMAGKVTVAVGGAKVATTVAVAVTATIGVATALGPQHVAQRAHARSSAASGALQRSAARRPGGALSVTAVGPSNGASAGAPAAAASAHGLRHGTATQAGNPARGASATAPESLNRRGGSRAQMTSTHLRAPGAAGSPPVAGPGAPLSSGGGNGQGHGPGAASGGQPPPQAGQGAGQGQGQDQVSNSDSGGSGHGSAAGGAGRSGSGESGDSQASGGGKASGSGGSQGAGKSQNTSSGDSAPLSAHGNNPVAVAHRPVAAVDGAVDRVTGGGPGSVLGPAKLGPK